MVKVNLSLCLIKHCNLWCNIKKHCFYKSHDSSVGIVLGYGLDNQGSRTQFLVGAGNFSLHHHVQTTSGAHPASYPRGTRALSLGVKWVGHEADHSPPSSAEIKE
jgi:hypothetical protein